MILVTGATGNVGREVVKALQNAGEPVRALVRSADARLPAGVESAVGDLNEPRTFADELAGARGVFLLSGYEGMPALLEEARRAGVERIVLLSGGAAVASRVDNPISQYMLRSEGEVQDSGIPSTIVRPCEFMSNALRWKAQLENGDLIRAPFADVPVAVIDPHDIGAVIATAMLSEGHSGQAYRLSGPESLLIADRVRILGEVQGRDLRFEEQPAEEARAEMSANMPAEYVEAFFSFNVDGTLDESQVLPTVEEITGKRPGTFERWAIAHADAFR